MSTKDKDLRELEDQIDKELDDILRLKEEKISLLRRKYERIASESDQPRNLNGAKPTPSPTQFDAGSKPAISDGVLQLLASDRARKWLKEDIVSSLTGRVDTQSENLDALIGATLQRLKRRDYVIMQRTKGKFFYSITDKGMKKTREQ